jgi:hypothetical protein
MEISITSIIASLNAEKQQPMQKPYNLSDTRLPAGFNISCYGKMIHVTVPHSNFKAGYHCNPKQPLPFIRMAAQKNFIFIYYMGLQIMDNKLDWFTKH